MKKKRKENQRPGYGKLLDAWQAPPDAGEPIGCIATSFTFSPVLFEEECLGRFLELETTPEQDGPLYLIEREEKLAQIRCAAALVDQHHCRGTRSLRWDLLPVRPKRGILHAKVSLLQWRNLIRLIVTSANLTEDGYRRNREVFGVVDFSRNVEMPLECLHEVVEFLREVLHQVDPDSAAPSPARRRCQEFLVGVRAAAEELAASIRPPRPGHVTVKAVLTGPGRPSVFEQMGQIWKRPTPPPRADVLSPFFDPPDSENQPAKRLWESLKQRGEASVRYYVTAEPIPGEENGLLLHAPESLLEAQPRGRVAVATEFYRLEDNPARPLHAKALCFEDERWAAYLIGSSNFTSAGLGIGPVRNYEANLVYWVDAVRAPQEYKEVKQAFPAGERVDLKQQPVRWQPRLDTEEDSPTLELLPLPRAFGPAVFRADARGNGFVRFGFLSEPPAGWSLAKEGEEDVFFGEAAWKAQGSPREIELPWPEQWPPGGFEVRWDGTDGCAWWPVNVENAASLPPPDELRGLSLETLIRVLTSARPLHIALRGWLKTKQPDGDDNSPEPVVDPHKRVDTSMFLLQRTRRVSWALTALAERLARPVPTEEALAWRLYGPVGVRALKEALAKEAKSAQEKSFLLAELALELSRVRPEAAPGCLPPERVKTEIRRIIHELHEEAIKDQSLPILSMERYIAEAFREALS